MRNHNIFRTSFAVSASYQKQVNEAINFISNNPMQCFADRDLQSFILNKTSTSFNTPMSQLFSHLINSYKSRESLPFVEIFITAKNPPEIFTYDSFTFDFADINPRVPEKMKGTVVNLTNSIKYKPSPSGNMYSTDDMTKLHSLYIRAALCQSYSNSGEKLWLSPQISLFLMKTYSMIMVKQISNMYHIFDPTLIKKLNFICQVFYANLLDKEVEKGYSELIFRSGLGSFTEVKDMFNELNDHGFNFEKQYGIHEMCAMLKAVSGDVLNNFDFVKMFKLFTAGSTDKSFAGISLDYPPYWAHQLLQLASGGRHPVYSTILKDSGELKNITAFAHLLNTTPAFIASLG